MRFATVLFSALLATSTARAADAKAERPVLSLSGANLRPLPLAIAAPLLTGPAASRPAARELDETLNQDLGVSGLFDLLDRKSFLADAGEGVLVRDIKFSRWQDVGAEGLVKVVITGTDPIAAELHLFNAVVGKEDLKKRYTGSSAEVRLLAHKIADDLFQFYTREPGPFQTRLAFVRKVKGIKQIFVSDWDGQNARPVTTASLNLLPAWSPDGQRLAHTSYQSGMPELWLTDLRGGKPSLLFHRYSALVTGACFSQDGKRVTFSMSEDDGNSHIWVVDARGENARRLTDGFGINSSPTFSPDGKQIAFVSNRAGNPQLYVIPADGGAPRRITFQGNYNQEPDWSPRADGQIAFTARDERLKFDVFLVNPESGEITRLTQDDGNNESPSHSPDGHQLTFVSTRQPGANRKLMVMDVDGNNQRRISLDSGEYETPAWGPRLGYR